MIGRYRVLPAADRDLDDQAAYLATQASLETALRFYDAASSTFGKIADMPGMGKRWESANSRLAGLRVWRVQGFEQHLIFYRPADDGIDIIPASSTEHATSIASSNLDTRSDDPSHSTEIRHFGVRQPTDWVSL